MSDTSAIPVSLLNATIDHLARFAPFSEMRRADLEWMVERLSLAYYPKGGIVLDPAQGTARQFHVIKQGTVVSERVERGAAPAEAHTQLVAGECFPLGALLANRPVANVYRAGEDTFCYQLSADHFTELLRRSHPFHDFCTRRLANLLERSKQVIQAQYTQATSAQQPLSSPLHALVRRGAVMCTPETPIRDALARMYGENVGSMVIARDEVPVGVFTLHDLLGRVALKAHDMQAPISSVMTPEPIGLPDHASAYEAALLMARHGIRHVLVLDGGRCAGVVSERDLFAVQRVGLTQISTNVRNAQRVDELVSVAADIRSLAHAMLAQGVGAEQLTQLISTLNDLLTTRVIELTHAQFDLHDVSFCWIALGSEGRIEQTLSTDQDNGIIFVAPAAEAEADVEAVRARLLPFACAVNEALDTCGFPLCKGGIMAGNSKWCLSLDEWDREFANWIHRGDAPVLLNASIFFDFRALYGVLDLASTLRERLKRRIGENRLFLRRMVENALANSPPLGLLRDFVVTDVADHPHSIDLKINGATPFVDAARIYALAAGVTATNTPARLRAVAAQWNWNAAQVEAWVEAFLFLQMLRLRLHEEQSREGKVFSNRIDPDSLNDLDRRILKEAFRQGRKLQGLLERDFQF